MNLSSILPSEELSRIPENVLTKLNNIFKEKCEEEVKTKALYESQKINASFLEKELNSKLEEATSKLRSAESQLSNVHAKYRTCQEENSGLNMEITCLREDNNKYRIETEAFKKQRDETVDENISLSSSLSRRNIQVEQLELELKALTEKLHTAVQAKVEALMQLDLIQVTKSDLDAREKKLQEEKANFEDHKKEFKNELYSRGEELKKIKKEHFNATTQLKQQLDEKIDENTRLVQDEEALKNRINQLKKREEELHAKVIEFSDKIEQLQEYYAKEHETKINLINLYKNENEEYLEKFKELPELKHRILELEGKLSEQEEKAKREMADIEEQYKAEIVKKCEAIEQLKKELSDANELIATSRSECLNQAIESMSPHAAAAFNIMKKGMTVTKMYTEISNLSKELIIKTHENEDLRNQMRDILQEFEAKAPIVQQRMQHYQEAMDTVSTLRLNYEHLENEHHTLKMRCDEAQEKYVQAYAENKKLSKTVVDLSRQVCFLLKDVEDVNGRPVQMNEYGMNDDTAEISNASQVVDKYLVTFANIQELQQNNVKLLSTLRNISEAYEEAEKKLNNFNNENYEDKVRLLENETKELNNALERQRRVVSFLKKQVSWYVMINKQQANGRNSISEFPQIPDWENTSITFDEDGMANISQGAVAMLNTSDSAVQNIKELQDKLEAFEKKITELNTVHAVYKEESSKNNDMLRESLEKAEAELREVKLQFVMGNASLVSMKERNEMLRSNEYALSLRITALESQCNAYSKRIQMQEKSLAEMYEMTSQSEEKLSTMTPQLEYLQNECESLKETNRLLTIERDVLARNRDTQANVRDTLEAIKVSMHRADAEFKMKMEEKLHSATQECASLRKRLQQEQDRYREKIEFLEKSKEVANQRLEEEKKANVDLAQKIEKLNNNIELKQKKIEELNSKKSETVAYSISRLESENLDLKKELNTMVNELELTKNLLESAKNDTEEVANVTAQFEEALNERCKELDDYKAKAQVRFAADATTIEKMQRKIDDLTRTVAEFNTLKGNTNSMSNKEIVELSQKHSVAEREIDSLRKEIGSLKDSLKIESEEKLALEQKYLNELTKYSDQIKEMNRYASRNIELEREVTLLVRERDEALSRIRAKEVEWSEREKSLKSEIESCNTTMCEIREQNELLFNKINQLSGELYLSQSQGGSGNISSYSTDSSTNEDTTDILRVLNFVRREKNIALSNVESLTSENLRLTSELELVKMRYEEMKKDLDATKESVQSTSQLEQHSEMMQKVSMYNAVVDSNAYLREEKIQLEKELGEVKGKLSRLENNKIIQLEDEIASLNSQVNSYKLEIVELQKECGRWKIRVNELADKLSKTINADEVMKSLTLERESHNKTLDELRSIKLERVKREQSLEQQIKTLQTKADEGKVTLQKEREKLLKEQTALAEEKTYVEKQLSEMRNREAQLSKTVANLERSLEENKKLAEKKEKEVHDMKKSSTQLRTIAKKYKFQNAEHMLAIDELKAENARVKEQLQKLEESGDHANANVANNQLTELNGRLAALNADVLAKAKEIERLNREVKDLNDAAEDKESRTKVVIAQARKKFFSVTMERDKAKKEMDDFKKAAEKEKAAKEESIARQNVMKSAFENRISIMEKEKNDLLAEKERLTREIEVLTYRINSFSSVGFSHRQNQSAKQEKGTLEPPTANIKPLAGTPSSKPQSTQHSVPVQPWRSGNETQAPLASIKPMSQTRTVAVPPQQQLVDTSTNASTTPHVEEAFSSCTSSQVSDYPNAPSTSTAVPPLRHMLVTPTQQNAQSAESTLAEEDEENIFGEDEMDDLIEMVDIENPIVEQPVSSAGQPAPTFSLPLSTTAQAPTVALVLPRIESHTSGPEASRAVVSASTQSDSALSESSQAEQPSSPSSGDRLEANTEGQEGISANGSNAVTTTQSGLKRGRDMSDTYSGGESCSQSESSAEPSSKRSRADAEHSYHAESEEGSDYQMPTSSNRGQEDDIISLDSDSEGGLDDGDDQMPDGGANDVMDEEEEFIVDDRQFLQEGEEGEDDQVLEADDDEEMDNDQYDDLMEGSNDFVEDDGLGNEVEFIEENGDEGSMGSGGSDVVIIEEPAHEEATSSRNSADGGNGFSQPPNRRQSGETSASYNLPGQQQLVFSSTQNFEESIGLGDDSIVPSTPTLCVPRRFDGFSEAVGSPQLPSGGRFTFADSASTSDGLPRGVGGGLSEGSDQVTAIDLTEEEDGRTVPSAPEVEGSEEGDTSGEKEEENQLDEASEPSNEDELELEDGGRGIAPAESDDLDNMVPNQVPVDAEQHDNDADIVDLNSSDESPHSEGDDAVTESSEVLADATEEGREAEALEEGSHEGPSVRRATGIPTRIPSMRSRIGRGMARGRIGRGMNPVPIVWENQEGILPPMVRGQPPLRPRLRGPRGWFHPHF